MFSLLDNKAKASSLPAISWSSVESIAPRLTDGSSWQPKPSVLDLLAAPTVFLQQALVYERDLDEHALRDALQVVVNGQPLFAARPTDSKAGHLQLDISPSTAGITLMQGQLSGLSLQQILPTSILGQPQQLQQQLALSPELPDMLFGHLPGALLPDYKDNADLALNHVAHVKLEGGGCVLGYRMSHLLGDWTSLRLLIQATAAAYSSITKHQQLCKDPGQHSGKPDDDDDDDDDDDGTNVLYKPGLAQAAPLLNQLVLEATKVLPMGFNPVRFKLLEPEDEAVFGKLAALSSNSGNSAGPKDSSSNNDTMQAVQGPRRLSYHVTPEKIQQLKTQAAKAGGAESEAQQLWCSTHNVLLAELLLAFIRLPGRQNLLHDISIAVDMRSRVPQQYMHGLTVQQQQQLQRSVGNFFATAIYEGCKGNDQLNIAQLAQELYKAVQKVQEIWLPDLAWASQVMGLELQGTSDNHQQPGSQTTQQKEQQVATPQEPQPPKQQQHVTWRRLHAMGPRRLLSQQMELGLLPSLSTTQWPLDHTADACMAGQLPVYAVPAFSQPQPYPLVLMQQAPAAAGGGMGVHVFLDESECGALGDALTSQ